jgi:hypothetical protein
VNRNHKTNTHHKKRRGEHQKRTKHFHSVYLPYLPGVIITLFSLFLGGFRPPHSTLAYATDVNISGLLQSTNTQRQQSGKASLSLNTKLNSAAQAKANDMVARNYWSHNTPDGQEPWVFISNAGYDYQKAGENLAYGFTSSDETITGWMNSPTHRDNLLDTGYTEVGFGFANSSNYNNDGEETVVVAMYGKPQVLSATAAKPIPTAQTTQTVAKANPTPTPAPVSAQPTTTANAPSTTKAATPVNTAQSLVGEPAQIPVTRLQAITKSQATWLTFAVGILSGAAITAMLIKHTLALRRLFKNSEKFVLHHPLFDTTMASLVILALVLTRTVGIIL